MRAGQRVQLKPLPQIAEALKLKAPTAGTVLCSYSIVRNTPGRSERLDVRLDSDLTLWGVAAEAFEPSGSAQPQA